MKSAQSERNYRTLRKPELPQSHPTQRLFEAYNKAGSFIRPLFRLYESAMDKSTAYDSAIRLRRQFAHDLPRPGSSLKTSVLPRASLSPNLLQKTKLINAFNTICDSKPSRGFFKKAARPVVQEPRLPLRRLNATLDAGPEEQSNRTFISLWEEPSLRSTSLSKSQKKRQPL